MNNLLLSLILLGMSASVGLVGYLSSRIVREENGALDRQLMAVRVSLEETTQALSKVQSDLRDQRRVVEESRTEAATAADAVTELMQTPADPASEGLWPRERQYFYLAKKHIQNFGYSPFHAAGQIGLEAVTLLGMTTSEEEATNKSFRDFFEKVGELQAARGQRLEAAAGVNNENHREIAYKLPDLIDEVGALRAELESALRMHVGDMRADLIWQRFPKPQTGQAGDHAYWVTYYADRNPDGTVQHWIRGTDGRGGGKAGVMFPPVPGTVLWQWRHLFGLEPLLPLPDAENKQ